MAASSSSATAAVRRLPLRQAISDLSSGEGSTSLPSRVKSLRLSFVAKNSPRGPREFVRSIAPRIAFANPSLPLRVDRIRDPRSKSLDPKSPDAGAKWEGGAMPPAELKVDVDGTTRTINITALSASQILSELLQVAGGPVDAMSGKSSGTGRAAASSPSSREAALDMRQMLDRGADTTYSPEVGKEPPVGGSAS